MTSIDTIKLRWAEAGAFHPDDEDWLRWMGYERVDHVRYQAGDPDPLGITSVWQHPEHGGRFVHGTAIRGIEFEGSIPRLMGATNHEARDLDHTGQLRLMLQEWLPVVRSRGLPPRVIRIDLAGNWRGRVGEVIQAYRFSKFPGIRRNPREFFGESIAWYGDSREVIIYDKGLEGGGRPDLLGRFETRWRGEKGLDAFPGPRLPEPVGCCLPVAVKPGRHQRERVIRWIPADESTLRGILLEEAGRFDQVRDVPGPIQTVRELALQAVARHTDDLMCLVDELPERTRRRFIRDLRETRASNRRLRIATILREQAA